NLPPYQCGAFTTSSAPTFLAADPLTAGTVYAAAACNQPGVVFKSTNGGGTWSEVRTGLPNADVRQLVIDPTASGVVYAATRAGVYKSANGGTSWAEADTGISSGIPVSIAALAMDPLDPSTLYAGGEFGSIFKTTNGAATWAHADTGFTSGHV